MTERFLNNQFKTRCISTTNNVDMHLIYISQYDTFVV
jgi:hypothetical protein